MRRQTAFIFTLFLSSIGMNVYAVCATTSCESTVRTLYLEAAPGRQYTLIQLDEDVKPLNCTPLAPDFIRLPDPPGKNAGRIYSTLLTAMMSGIPVIISVDVSNPAADCVVNYVVIRKP